jgi:acyl-CoA synthetase (AMP-forming)/AMP-acid ligase II
MSQNQLPQEHAGGVFGVTIGGLFKNQARMQADRRALETAAVCLTYRELDARSNRLANELLRLGVRRGDCVAVLSENRHEYVEVQLACAKLGVPVACQNWRLSDSELAYCLELVGPALIFVSPRLSGRLPGLLPGGCPGIEFGADYGARLRSSRDDEPIARALPEDPWVILYTSGSTGYPKAAAISHRALVARGAIAVTDGIVQPGMAYVAWAPMFHIASTDSTMITLLHGGKAILMDGFDAEAIVETVTSQDVGTLSLMPATVGQLVQALQNTPRPVRRVLSTGAMADLVPPHLIAEVTTLLNAPFRNSFGSTETGYAPAGKGLIPVGVAPKSFSKTQSSYCEIRLVDDDGQDVAEGEPGEVLVRGPSLFSGYWNAAEVNRDLFRSGWFAMGDVMRRNADGTLDFVDRRKYLIKSGGENIYPAEIERLLLESPRIVDAVVVRQPHDHWGEVPVAFVVPADGSVDEAEVLQLCRGRIANYKLPKRVIFITAEELPRTALGKIQRHRLEERLRDPQ